jgi:signal peptidase I
MKSKIMDLWKSNKSFVLFLALMFIFRSAIADWNEVPSGSMLPTIVEGDRIFVNRMAYDLRIPFTHISLLKRADPQRGDIIIFDSVAADLRLVKRVIGVPGDVIAMTNNVLTINGKVLPYDEASSGESYIDITENLLGITHKVRLQNNPSRLSNFDKIVVPDDYYLALGDNRDKSSDSRVIGYIPRDEIVGRSKYVVASLNYNNYYLPRSDRFFKAL